MFCHYCGSNIDEGMDYCLKCGKPVVKDLGSNNTETYNMKKEPNDLYEDKPVFKESIRSDVNVNEPYYNNQFNEQGYSNNSGASNKRTVILGVLVIAIALAIGLAVYSFIGGGGSSPEEAVKGFFTNIGKGDIKKAMEYTNLDEVVGGNDTLNDVFIKQLENEFSKGEVGDMFSIVGGLLESATYEVISEDGDRATVRITLTFMGESNHEDIKVVKVKNKWKLDIGSLM